MLRARHARRQAHELDPIAAEVLVAPSPFAATPPYNRPVRYEPQDEVHSGRACSFIWSAVMDMPHAYSGNEAGTGGTATTRQLDRYRDGP